MLINLTLLSNNEKVIEHKNKECIFKDNIMKYYEDEILNIIDLNLDTFKRISPEFIFTLYINEKKFTYKLIDKDMEFETKIEVASIKKEKDIEVTYKIDDELKKIIIQYVTK